MLSIVDAIGTAIGWVLKEVLSPILLLVVRAVIEPIVVAIYKAISIILGFFFYSISTFILQLIDFVEVLFRALAGLEPVSQERLYATLSLNGQDGDILVQLIRNPSIQQAFISMCIVGLFLLVITTVFQIIKVEYTTEGAKNAKGPIFAKALKSLANLTLLPLLVVFGTILANQILGLLDTATRGDGENPTISGQIFVTAASEAIWRKNESKLIVVGGDVLYILVDNMSDIIEDAFSEESADAPFTGEFEFAPDRIKQIEAGFVQQESGYRYYDIVETYQYYNIGRINYLVLLFGSVVVLKCFFFTAIGLIIRLYKCAVLFVISPVVIGMTPINEGGLGKWRSSFIGQVLSAYGTVLAINLFFIIVKVLLNIEIKFINADVLSGYLTANFMTSLLKSIMVIAGCLLIEKFAKEIGGYFGAEDAMSAGKDMSNQVVSSAMKGVTTMAAVGMGGMALAKGVGGIAGKIRDNYIVKKDKALDSRIDAAKEKLKDPNLSKDAKDVWESDLAHYQKAKAKNDGRLPAAQERIKKRKESKFSISQADYYKDKQTANNARISEIDERIKQGGLTEEAQSKLEDEKKGLVSQNDTFEEMKTSDKGYSEYAGKMKEEQSARAKIRAYNMFTGMAEEGKKNMPGFKQYEQFKGYEDAGAKVNGDEFAAVTDKARSDKKDQQKDLATFLMGGTLTTVNQAGARLIATELSKSISENSAKLLTALQKATNIASKDYADSDTDGKKQVLKDFVAQVRGLGADISITNAATMLGNGPDQKVSLGDFSVKVDAKEIAEKIRTAISGKTSMQDIMKAIEGVKNEYAGKGLDKAVQEIEKALEEIKKKLDGAGK